MVGPVALLLHSCVLLGLLIMARRCVVTFRRDVDAGLPVPAAARELIMDDAAAGMVVSVPEDSSQYAGQYRRPREVG